MLAVKLCAVFGSNLLPALVTSKVIALAESAYEDSESHWRAFNLTILTEKKRNGKVVDDRHGETSAK